MSQDWSTDGRQAGRRLGRRWAAALVAATVALPALAEAPAGASAAEAGDAQAEAGRLTIDRLVASPSLSGATISSVRFSPDGRLVTYLKGRDDDATVRDLWAHDLETGRAAKLADAQALLGGEAEALSEVEKARRERQRITGSGIVAYQWSPDGQSLLFPLGGDLYLLTPEAAGGDGPGGTVRRLTETGATETDAKFSPQGRYVSFVRDADLYVIDLDSGAETRVTRVPEDSDGAIINARAEFVAQEEMKRTTGYWWAPDDSRIVYARVDRSPVAEVARYEVAADGGVTTVAQRYPFAGTDNALVALRVVAPDGGGDRALGVGADSSSYIARVAWMPDSARVTVQRQSRDQKRLDLLSVAVDTGAVETLLTETADTWVNIHHNPVFVDDGRAFLWTSERSGYPQLYRVDVESATMARLTRGAWAVLSSPSVDEAGGWVYFTANADTPVERHFYRVPLDPAPEDMERVTRPAGWHSASVSPDGRFVVDRYSAPDTPPRVALLTAEGERVAYLSENRLGADHPYAPYLETHAPVRFGTIEAEDGTALHYSLRLPADYKAGRRYPTVIAVYGGPGVQRVSKSWSLDFNQILARQGYAVMALDNRGSANRGQAFEGAIYRQMGRAEVADQLAGLDHLIDAGIADPERVGVWGWSYGGYMTLMLLAQAPERFAAGLSVAPVTDWTLYDTHYTERFLGLPQDHDGYAPSNVFRYLDGFRDDRLMLVHGMADDNVFFDHSVKLISALQDRRVRFDLMGYPGKRHGIRGTDTRAHLWRDALDFFTRRMPPGR
ncbi:dipeptidyl-peptidase IV [Rhodothalassium salexigens DSM 2132]|uniref:Dipeptidyl-peptidase IV n=1 Tax=Rhodothalassium salexigens DSM 2132 TaxID=1188247 RepID=A0A4R2PGX4_RHOSA|nr:S9 family peptidase [Rhodothalassium salexigens]MBB4212015.1 dipeptidyl-peptidase-4 [Rhodothalassium salexigens DSM 2132]MBK1638499.1 hypothetical protein [Rhodothalassium salexigens DSM 2132]TCP33401.1 dipeptidyl-peptidase IV [Rhodothalassium salexigens DSM 2132]